MSILKIKDSQGNWIGVPTVKGDTGNGISSTALNDDYTLTLSFTDGTTYTTPSIRGEKGEQGDPATSMEIHICSASEYDAKTRIPTIANPNDKTFYLVPTEDGTSPDLFTEWVYANNAWEMFGSAKIDLSNYVMNTDYATNEIGGVVKVNSNKGLAISSSGVLETSDANVAILKDGTDRNSIVSARRLAPATFYGLAKASGDTTQSKSDNPVGTYTDEAKASIKNMLGVEDVDLHYLTPEMYGAVGDGSTDDSAAIQNCINDAIAKELPVRGFNIYATTQPINIVAKYLNLYIHEIIYSGDDVAVILTGRYNIINIDEIDAYDSTGCGFRLATTEEREAIYNEIHIGYIASYGNGIEYLNLYGESQGLYYNKLYINQLYSRNANCIYINATNRQCGENSFWGKHVTNNNGYFLYCVDGGNNISNKFYEFCIESSSKNGVYGQATLINCRTVECMDRKKPDNDEGMIFTFNGVLPIAKAINTHLDYLCVDVTNASTYESRLALIKNRLEEGETKAGAFDAGFPQEMTYIIGEGFRLWDYYSVTDSALGNNSPIGKIIAYYNHKGFVPDYDWYHKIEVNDYYTLTTDHKVPTIFDIDVNTTIHLDDSYCPVGIKEFKVIQYDDKKAAIYDHNNHLIFNGQNYNAGTYRIKCRLAEHTFDVIANSETFTYGDIATRGKYFGMNDEWSVEQVIIDEISTLEDSLDNKAPVITETISGDIVSFDDGANDMPLQSLVVDINPVQDLHGYDSPWVGGGGKNLADYDAIYHGSYDTTSLELNPVSEQYRTIIIDNLDAGTYTFSTDLTDCFVLRYAENGVNHGVSTAYTAFTFTVSAKSRLLFCFRKSDSSVITEAFKVQIEKGSTATDWTPYENICPISGFTGCEVQRTGKNLLNADTYYGDYKQSDGSYLLSASNLSIILIPLKTFIGKTVTFSTEATIGETTNLRVRAFINGRATNGTSATNNATSTISITTTPVTDDDYIHITYGSGGSNPVTLRNVQLEEGSAVTTYESFGQTYPITFPSEAGIVYGAYVDVLNGELVVDRAMVVFDGSSDEQWTYYAVTHGNLFRLQNYSTMKPTADIIPAISNAFKAVLQANRTNGTISSGIGGTNVDFIFDRANSLTEWMEWLAENNIQLCYELATPVRYPLTPTEIKTLLGQNNLWANTGDTTMTYRADTELYIDKQISDVPVDDVQINGTSIVENGVANVPIATGNRLGVVQGWTGGGTQILSDGRIGTVNPSVSEIKAGSINYKPIPPSNQHISTFYGLAKAAGDTTQSQSDNSVGEYTSEAKTAIKQMLGVKDDYDSLVVEVSGTDPVITGKASYRYNCGELYTLSITPPLSGTMDIIFTSGATPTVLTLPETVKMPDWWAGIETNTTYEMCITDGMYCGVMSWAT